MVDEFKEFLAKIDKEAIEMDKQEGKHCERCHAVIISNVYNWSNDYPVVSYEEPKRCQVCKSTNYRKDDLQEGYLPKPEEGLLCKCQHPKCEKEFFNRPTWYRSQQEISDTQGNPWMPILIEQDQAKIDTLLNESSPTISKK